MVSTWKIKLWKIEIKIQKQWRGNKSSIRETYQFGMNSERTINNFTHVKERKEPEMRAMDVRISKYSIGSDISPCWE